MCALRIGIDDMQGKIVRGESVDVAKLLSASEALAKLLPPSVLAEPPSAADEPDPKQTLLEIYMGMRKRGEIADPTSTFEGRMRRIAELEAENAALKAQLAGAPAPDESAAAEPAAPGNVVPLRAPAPAPEEEFEEVVVTEAVLGAPEPWRGFIDSNGDMNPTPGRKFWGPA